MNNIAMAQATQNAVKSKFRGKKTLKSKVKAHFPANLEREYVRLANAYMATLKTAFDRHYPQIQKAAARVNVRTDARERLPHDMSYADFERFVDRVLFNVSAEWEKQEQTVRLENKLETISELTRRMSVQQWKRAVKATLGINILEDYYMGEMFANALKTWTTSNAELIKNIGQEALADMKTAVLQAFTQGKTNKTLAKEILANDPRDFGFQPVMERKAYDEAMKEYGKAKRKAEFIARDQLAKLNADISQQQQEDAGVTEYVWSTSGDGRVRERHAELNGKRFKYEEPPIVDEKTGRRAHPGQDFRCRCVALPVFDIEGLDLPWMTSETEERS